MEKRVCFERRWFMCDYARQRSFVREAFSLFLDGLARLGYNGVGLYLEGAFAFASIPGVIREGVMTKDDAIRAIEKYAHTHERAIAKTGHTRNDLTLLSETVDRLNRIKALLLDVGNAVDRIPFPRFERLLDRATVGKFIIT